MFHVSTMIPASQSDEQQVERKRHLGNDVVMLIFKEGNDPFSPSIIRSHFNSVFLVVQKVVIEGSTDTFYQLAVSTKDSISPFPPFLPECPIYKKNRSLRDLIISKSMLFPLNLFLVLTLKSDERGTSHLPNPRVHGQNGSSKNWCNEEYCKRVPERKYSKEIDFSNLYSLESSISVYPMQRCVNLLHLKTQSNPPQELLILRG